MKWIMDMVEHTKQIELAEVDMARLLNGMRKCGLTYHDIIRILTTELENTLIQFEVDCQLQVNTHHNQSPAP